MQCRSMPVPELLCPVEACQLSQIAMKRKQATFLNCYFLGPASGADRQPSRVGDIGRREIKHIMRQCDPALISRSRLR